MKKILTVSIAIAIAIVAMATGTKLWVHSHSGNHWSIDVEDLDSISFVEPGMLELSFYEKTLSNSGGGFTLNITANKPWTASVNDQRLTLGATSGDGNAQLAVTALPNVDEDNPYTAIITITLSNGVYKQAVVTVGEGKDPVVPEFSINMTSLSLEIGNEYTLVVSNYKGVVDWIVDEPEIVSISPSNGADCIVKGLKEGSATVTAKNGDKTVSCNVTVKKSADEFPHFANPGVGKAIVAFYYEGGDQINCNGISFHGTNDNWASTTDAIFDAVDGYPGWYYVELELGVSSFNFDYYDALYAGKVCLLQDNGTVDAYWSTQWASNCTIVKDTEYGAFWNRENDNILVLTGSSVVYIMVPSFQDNPCIQPKTYRFSIKLPALCDEEDVVSIIGPSNDWNSDIVMEFNTSTGYYEVEVEGRATSQFKIRKNGYTEGWNELLLHKVFNEETDEYEWKDYDNTYFGENTSIVLDRSADGWKNCLPE